LTTKPTKVKSNIKSAYQLRKEKYKFDVGDMVIHIGKLYDQYKLKTATIMSRNTRKSIPYYLIEFEDGKQMEVKETWIKGLDEKVEKEIEKGEADEDNQTEL
jgi:hypothetical protein